MDRTGAPSFAWLLAMCYVSFVLNHTCNVTIKNMPLNAATGSTYDMSPLLRFHFWESVFFNTEDNAFPSESPKQRGRFVGISDNVVSGAVEDFKGHVMTNILTNAHESSSLF